MKAPLTTSPRTTASAPVAAPHHRVVVALARVEAVRLIRHPALVLGVVLSLLWLRMYMGPWVAVLHRDDISTAPALFPLAAMTLIASNLAALRLRRDGSEELYGGVPVSEQLRTVGHLLALVGAAAVGAVIAGAWVVWAAVVLDGVGRPSPAELATGPFIVVVAGVVGVALARWIPVRQAGFLAVLGLAALQLVLMGPSDVTRALAPWVAPPGDDLLSVGAIPRELLVRRPAVHLAYLAGLAGLLAAIALLRVRRTRRVLAVAGTSLALVAGTAWVKAQPPSPTVVAAMVDFLEHPERAQDCQWRGRVRYCAYPSYAPLVDRWAEVVERVLTRVPEHVRLRPLQVRQRTPFDAAKLPREAEAQLTFRPSSELGYPVGRGDDRAVHPDLRWGRGPEVGLAQVELALAVAGWALDLPTEGSADGRACQMDRQARTVIALWLAGQATPDTEEALGRVFERSGEAVRFSGLRWFSGFGGATVVWNARDVSYAVRLLDRPVQEVAELIRTEWDWLSDPTVSSEVLASRLGLADKSDVASSFDPSIRPGPSFGFPPCA